jgi:hypothetical protein
MNPVFIESGVVMDERVIPKGIYCYDDNGICSYWRMDKKIKKDFYGYGHESSVWCDYLGINSAVLDFEGIYEKNGAKCYSGHLLNDMCKICGVNTAD